MFDCNGSVRRETKKNEKGTLGSRNSDVRNTQFLQSEQNPQIVAYCKHILNGNKIY